jgi:hypothetical protein
MPILTPDETATLKAFVVAHPALDDQGVFDAIHAPTTVANPVPQGVVSVPFSELDLVFALSAETVNKFSTSAVYSAVQPYLTGPKTPEVLAKLGQFATWSGAGSARAFGGCGNRQRPGGTGPRRCENLTLRRAVRQAGL